MSDPASAATQTPVQQAEAIATNLVNTVLGQGLVASKGLLTNFFNSVSQDNSLENLVASGASLAVQAPLLLPGLEDQAIQDIGQYGNQLTALIPTKVSV